MAVAEEEDDAEEARGRRGREEGPGRDGLEPVPDRPQGLCGEQSEQLTSCLYSDFGNFILFVGVSVLLQQ